MTDSFPDFYDFRDQSQSFSAMAAYTGAGTVLTGAGDAQELRGVAANGDIFQRSGVNPMLGRGFTAEETKRAGGVVLFSHGLWKRAFSSDPNIVGQQVNFAGESYTVLGIMPPGWQFPLEANTGSTSDYIMPLEPLVATECAPARIAFPEVGWAFETGRDGDAGGGGAETDRSPHGAAISGHEYRIVAPA